MSNLAELENYRILTSEEISEVNGKGYVLEHIKTKARVLIIENDDTNKVFTIGFRTPPYDDSGIPHILEHSVLCGSKKYPVKDPFVELAKGSLNTFLNAMTYSDKTVYPIAAYNNQDFENLMKVYLDAVFYPNIYIHSEIMRQEGWHYELESAESELTYNGVVYNEMKGVFSSAEQQLYRAIEMSLLPDTPYSKESGGDPKAIPTLTQERFEEFHQTYYHPSNSYIYLYGDCDMEKELRYIDEEYLSKYEYREVDSAIALQTPFDNMKYVEKYYSIAENESEENSTYLAYSKVIGSSLDKKQSTAMAILEYALMDAPGAPLKKALVDAGIGEDVFSSFDGGIQQTSYSIIAKNANESDKDLFIKTIETTLKQASENLDKRSVEAAINNFEFKHKEANFGRYPKGLMLGLDAFNSWLYDGDALTYFKMNEVYAELKDELKTDYFEKLIKDRLLDNEFGAIVVMKPKKGLDKADEQAEREKLAAFKATLNDEELEELVKATKELKKYQEEPSPAEDMEKVPLLNISDIDKQAKKLKNRKLELAGVPAVHHDIFTNGIGYLEFFFKINDLDEEFIPYITLLTAIFKYVDTENYSYGELSNEINFHTGGIAFATGAFNNVNKSMTAYFSVKTKAMYDKLKKAIVLIEEILKTSKIDDKKRLKEIISEEKAGMKTDLAASGHISAANRAMSYIDKAMAFKDMSE
ncbi:MAG: insulinase family protein, partial [Coprococcus sp.]